MDAFVTTPFLKCGSKTFHGQNVQTKPSTLTANVRMSTEKEKESSVFGKAGNSLWKENPFTGGFPGGEKFFNAWIDGGMTKDVPDMPDSMQSKTKFKPTKEKKSGVLALLDKTEFFNDFIGKGQTDPDDDDEDDSEDAEEEKVDEDPIPSESLYEAYFPASRRNIAPMINMVYEKDFVKDRVYLSMREVAASATDLYFPKETKNKAPIIEVSYNGSSLNGAYVKMSLDYVDNLPTLAPPPKSGEARASLVPGRGGGLKLEYSVAGEGVVNI